MADTEDTKPEGGEGDGREGARRGTGRNRGERSPAGRGGAPSQREIEAALSNMDPARLAALLSITQARGTRGPATPKISHTLDKLSPEQARDVIAACDEAIEVFDEAARDKKVANTDQAVAPIRDVNPEVVAAMFNNSAYRNKPIEHSVRVTRTYLASRHGDDTAVSDEAAAG